MPLNHNSFYTMQVLLNSDFDKKGTQTGTAIEYVNINTDRIDDIKRAIFMQGILHENPESPGSFELIDPLRIRHVFFIEQKEKIVK